MYNTGCNTAVELFTAGWVGRWVNRPGVILGWDNLSLGWSAVESKAHLLGLYRSGQPYAVTKSHGEVPGNRTPDSVRSAVEEHFVRVPEIGRDHFLAGDRAF